MANHNLLLRVAVFGLLIYAAFRITVQFTGTSMDYLTEFKPFRTDQNDESVHGNVTTYPNDTHNFVAGFTITSPDVIPLTSSTPAILSRTFLNNSTERTDTLSHSDRKPAEMKPLPKEPILEVKPRKVALKPIPRTQAKNDTKCLKRILFWCDNYVAMNKTFVCKGCKLQVTSAVNLELVKEADAVLFYHMIEKPWEELIRARRKGQIWIFFSRESPHHCKTCMPPPLYGNVFNLSITYLSDSDVVVPYGQFYPFTNRTAKHNEATAVAKPWTANKTKNVVWVASNCQSASWDRTQFVRHLSKYTPVDAYGRCGDLSCPKADALHCEEVFSQYKFYLALENSHCREYITEKVWHNSLDRSVVPVVFGADRKDYENVLPPNSFIFAQDFNSTRQLARYLDKLARNDTLYGEFFKWREKGTVKRWTRSTTFKRDNLCFILQKIIDIDEEPAKIIRKIPIEEWWRSSCSKSSNWKFADK